MRRTVRRFYIDLKEVFSRSNHPGDRQPGIDLCYVIERPHLEIHHVWILGVIPELKQVFLSMACVDSKIEIAFAKQQFTLAMNAVVTLDQPSGVRRVEWRCGSRHRIGH